MRSFGSTMSDRLKRVIMYFYMIFPELDHVLEKDISQSNLVDHPVPTGGWLTPFLCFTQEEGH